MTAVAATKSRVAVGLLNASGYARGVKTGAALDMHDGTTLVDAAKVYQPGQYAATFSLDMILDSSTAANGQFDVFNDWELAGTPYPITVGYGGFAVGSLVRMLNGLEADLSIGQTLTDLVTVAASGVSTGGVDYGVVLEDFTAVTIDGNGTARDGGAGTANGGVAHLHVSDFSGLTNNIVTIEHSTTGVGAWSTLVTFTTYTGVSAYRVEVAAATTVNRYLRVVDNVTGTGSTTRLVAFARR